MNLAVRNVEWQQRSNAAVQRELPSNDDPPVVVFNHLYVVVDEVTFRLMRDFQYFRHEFAAVDTGFSKFAEVNEDSQSIYFRGQQTYLEIFGPHNKLGEPVGKVGLGFRVEKFGGFDWVENNSSRNRTLTSTESCAAGISKRRLRPTGITRFFANFQ